MHRLITWILLSKTFWWWFMSSLEGQQTATIHLSAVSLHQKWSDCQQMFTIQAAFRLCLQIKSTLNIFIGITVWKAVCPSTSRHYTWMKVSILCIRDEQRSVFLNKWTLPFSSLIGKQALDTKTEIFKATYGIWIPKSKSQWVVHPTQPNINLKETKAL